MYIHFCISKNVKKKNKYTFYPCEINNLTTVLQLIMQVVRLIKYLHEHVCFCPLPLKWACLNGKVSDEQYHNFAQT